MPKLFISSRQHKVFTDRKRKVLRKRIPNAEVGFSIVFIAILVAMGIWFAMKKDDFDPSERDVSLAVLEEDTVIDNLYRTPLKRWVDPTVEAAGTGSVLMDLTPFPGAILDGGWQPSSRLQHFTKDNLYEKINGAADQFFQFGFVQLHYIAIAKPDEQYDISIELYDMGALENAMGIFAAQRDGDADLVDSGSAHYYETTLGAIGIAGPYYFKVVGNVEDTAIVEKARRIVAALGEVAGKAAAPPRPYVILTQKLGIPFDSILFEKSDVFQYDFAKDFWFGKAGSDPSFQYYVHESANEDEAASLYERLLENHLFDYDEVTRADDEVVLRHKFLNTYLSLNKKNNVVYGVDGAPEPAVLEEATERLDAALGEELDEAEAYSAS